MPEKFDFSTKEGQQDFKKLSKQEKDGVINNAYDTANQMQELLDKNSRREDYDAAHELVEENKLKNAPAAKDYHEELKYNIGEKAEADREGRIQELIGGRFEKVISGTWNTESDDILKITILRSPINKETRKAESLQVIAWYKNNVGKEAHQTLILLGNCQLSATDKEMKKMGVSRAQVYDELVRIFENVNFDLYENIEDSLLPPDPYIWPKGDGPGPEEETDSRRIKFMENHPKLLFGVAGINSGFRGYYGYVFQNFIVMENEKLGNAAYFIPLSNVIEFNEEKFKLNVLQRVERTRRKEILNQNKDIFARLTKSQVLTLVEGARRKKHPNREQEEEVWRKKMQKEIDARLQNLQAA